MTDTFQIQNFIDVDRFTAEIEEDMSDLTEAMRTQTARCAYYGMLHAKSKRQLAEIDRIISAVEASLKTSHRAALTNAALEVAEQDGSKPERITADMVSAAVHMDPRMLKLMRLKAEAEEIETVCKVAYNAFKTRESMLISLGNMTRDMMKSSMRIMGDEAKSSIDGYRRRRAERTQDANA